MNIVYLNVGGKKFETNLETLKFSPYFRGIMNLKHNSESDSWSCKETPYFIDRDPKIFRHVLNLLRNPEYNYPEKYVDELEFYGFSIKEIKEQIRENKETSMLNITSLIAGYDNNLVETNFSHSVDSNKINEILKFTYVPEITFFKQVYKRHTNFNPAKYTTYLFDTKNWSHEIRDRDMLLGIDLLIPEYFSDKLDYFTVKIKFCDQDFSFNLDGFQYIKSVRNYDGLLCFNISSVSITSPLFIYKNNNNVTIELNCTYEGDKKVESVLKLKTVILCPEEQRRFYQLSHEYLGHTFSSYDIINGEFILPIGCINCIVFNIDYDYVGVEYLLGDEIINHNSFNVSKFDARYMSKHYVDDKAKECPDNYGILNFCIKSNICDMQPNGHLESDGNYRIKFYGNGTKNGRIWISKYVFIIADSNNGIKLNQDKMKSDITYE